MSCVTWYRFNDICKVLKKRRAARQLLCNKYLKVSRYISQLNTINSEGAVTLETFVSEHPAAAICVTRGYKIQRRQGNYPQFPYIGDHISSKAWLCFSPSTSTTEIERCCVVMA